MARPPKTPHKNTPKEADDGLTPLMRQYYKAKQQHPDAVLLFRVGDFYETFGADAITASRVLGITLTSRNNGGHDTELAGFPYHAVDTYLPKLVRAGYRVAICEQLEKPQPGKVVRRGVTEIITPGVTVDDKLLDQRTNNYLAVVAMHRQEVGLALLDVSTGELLVTEGDWAYMDKTLQMFAPAEVVFAKNMAKTFKDTFGDRYYTYGLEDWVFQDQYGREKLLSHFNVLSLKGFGVEDMALAQTAAGAALHYLAATENKNLQHIVSIARLLPDKYVWLDRFTMRNLELVSTHHESGKSLLDVLDKTHSPMGARLMKKWVVLPLKTRHQIESRLEMVRFFVENPDFKADIETIIKQMGDLERLVSKVPMGKIGPREVRQLARSLALMLPLQTLLRGGLPSFVKMADTLNPCTALRTRIETTLVEEPPALRSKGGMIADGADAALDELRHTVRNAQTLLANIQQQEIEKTGISSLKIGFNNVFGYYLEVTARYKHTEIPKEWIRKQTLANAERYITPELKVLEEKILGAEEKIAVIEDTLFTALIDDIFEFIQPIQQNAHTVAMLDCLRSFAEVAVRHQYVAPQLNDGFAIDIKAGRHPVIEQQLPLGDAYVPNDVSLNPNDQQILMITGPNMAGKSALLRQTALICLMAQMGSFVPAAQAEVGILDKVFTRVGASDNISSGESTFMVEMNETASIMNNLSDRSLILLDEIGRGTSTYDGISIAWSIAEYLSEHPSKPKTLFATHYHELNALEDMFVGIKNYHISTRELGQKVVFLRKLVRGGSEHSFGVHVARMAGMPASIVSRANDILAQLEQKQIDVAPSPLPEAHRAVVQQKVKQATEKPMQLNFFDIGDPRLQRIKDALDAMDLNTTTPIELMMKVSEWKKMLDN